LSNYKAILIFTSPASIEASQKDEFISLTKASGIKNFKLMTYVIRRPQPRFYIGKGKTEELKNLAEKFKPDVIIFSNPLSPSQERNLEKIVGYSVIDRTRLILDIFAQRASSYEGKIQVELAQLKHFSTRLVRGWTHLERQKGGIGLRGPGEKQLETDRRLIGGRIKKLNLKLSKIAFRRDMEQRHRRKGLINTVSIIGYTNAGKTTLFNYLCHEKAFVKDQLFATLDSKIRTMKIGQGEKVLISDTVGFVSNLPLDLVASFKSTLSETVSADLLLHVIDLCDEYWESKKRQVDQVLLDIGADEVPTILVFNKIDAAIEENFNRAALVSRAEGLFVSAALGTGIKALADQIRGNLKKPQFNMVELEKHLA
jgi:GTP-binding protein HflX